MPDTTHETPRELTQAVQLDWTDDGGVVTVTPRDKDRFILKVRRAVVILQQMNQAEEFEKQFTLLLRLLAEWLGNQNNIHRAFLTHRDGALAFVIVRQLSEYDEQFEDRLSDLDFDIANDADLKLIKMDAICLPRASREAVSSFLDPEFMLEYVGHGN